jgi:hypothetical protein
MERGPETTNLLKKFLKDSHMAIFIFSQNQPVKIRVRRGLPHPWD